MRTPVKSIVLLMVLGTFLSVLPTHAQALDPAEDPNASFRFDQNPLRAKTKGDCDTAKTTLLNVCLGKIDPQGYTEETKIKMKADCETTASTEYRKCMYGVKDMSTMTKESGYQIPDANVLDQFQGLSAQQVIGNIMATAMKIMGSIAFAMMVFAGFLWMTAAGNSDKERKARDIMVWSALGVIVILSSYSLVKLVFDAFAS